MPTVSVDKEDLYKALGRSYTTQEFDDLCFDFGLELDEDTTDNPVTVNGVVERPVLKIEIPANRYDLLCIEGIARALNIFLDRPQPPLPNPTKSSIQLIVDKETEAIRPFVSAAVIRGITFSPRVYASFIALQDKLHTNLCRNRTLVSMGTHDLDNLSTPVTYEAVIPKDIKFIPLRETKEYDGESLIKHYESDRHLGKFLHIIKDFDKYPVMYDSKKNVCSLPPIINSQKTRITLDTKNVFIEITATDKVKADIVCNILVSMFAEHAQGIEQVQIISEHNGQSRWTPDLSPVVMKASKRYINACCGLDLDTQGIIKALGRMTLDAKQGKEETNDDLIDVYIPPTRPDILHQCDIMEDAAIGYGFNELPRTMPDKLATVGKPFPLAKLSDIFRVEAANQGWLEVMPLILCSYDENFTFLRKESEAKRAVRLENPKTIEYQVVRTSLIPGVLKTIKENKQSALPMKIFEASDVVYKDDENVQQRSRNERHFCAAYAGKSSGFEVVHGLLDHLMGKLKVKFGGLNKEGYVIEELKDEMYFPGRAASIILKTEEKGKQRIGSLGILHPWVLDKYEIPYPTTVLEINIEPFL